VFSSAQTVQSKKSNCGVLTTEFCSCSWKF